MNVNLLGNARLVATSVFQINWYKVCAVVTPIGVGGATTDNKMLKTICCDLVCRLSDSSQGIFGNRGHTRDGDGEVIVEPGCGRARFETGRQGLKSECRANAENGRVLFASTE